MAASESEKTDSYDSLRAKYVELAAKYRQLVERVERRATQDLVIYRLGAWGMEATTAALAVVEGDVIRVANARFTALARSIHGPLIAVEPPSEERYADLRSMILGEAARIAEVRGGSRELRVRDEGGDALLSIHLELSRRGTGPTVMVLAENITDQVRRDSELKRTRDALLHRERLRVLGELAVSIAHDLGNTLRGASFQLTSLDNPNLSADQRKDVVHAIGSRIELASAVISRLHEFARTGSLSVSAVRIDRIVHEAAALVEAELREGELVEVRMSMPHLPPVRGSAAELSLMFVNLLRNARDAMPEGGVITVTGTRTRNGIAVAVADQGEGLTPTAEKRLFEPFFSTKGARGTGLGLWLAAGTMQRLGGTITAVNRPRGGALFTLTFPAQTLILPRTTRPAAKPPAAASREPTAPAARRTRRARRSASRT